MNENSHIVSYFKEDLFNSELNNKKLNFKFVIIRNQETLNLIYGPLDFFPYHANLVNKFCEDYNIPSAWSKKPDLVEIFHPDYQIKGGGWVELHNPNKLLSFYSCSTAYGKFQLPDLKSIIVNKQNFIDYEIEFD
ncbi:MAG: hypothetical protein U9N54_05105 [candidate division Zixibacteria bacterium]|nr:hypothetical protein [candidate division Zixibacteria bacterium]